LLRSLFSAFPSRSLSNVLLVLVLANTLLFLLSSEFLPPVPRKKWAIDDGGPGYSISQLASVRTSVLAGLELTPTEVGSVHGCA
jgi:hypothetical protein